MEKPGWHGSTGWGPGLLPYSCSSVPRECWGGRVHLSLWRALQPMTDRSWWINTSTSLDNSEICFTLCPGVPGWGWASVAQSDNLLGNSPYTGFFPFPVSLPDPPTSTSRQAFFENICFIIIFSSTYFSAGKHCKRWPTGAHNRKGPKARNALGWPWDSSGIHSPAHFHPFSPEPIHSKAPASSPANGRS